MTKKFRFLFFTCIAVLSLSLAACQNAPEPTVQVEETVPSENSPDLFEEMKATKPWKIAYVPKTSAPDAWPYWVRARQGAEQAAADFEVEVIITAPAHAPSPDFAEDQIAIIAEIVAQGDVDGLVIGPLDSNRLAPVIEQAVAAGIPVIAHSTPVNSDSLLTFVSEDDIYKGRFMGQWVTEQLGGEGNVLILGGPSQQQNALNRRNAILDGLSGSNIQVLNVDETDWSTEVGYEITRGWLEQYDDIDAIIGVVDNVALGASQAVAEAKRDGILITGFGAHQPQLVKDGQITATLDQIPQLQARRTIQLMIRHLEHGETFEPTHLIREAPFLTQDNIDNYLD